MEITLEPWGEGDLELLRRLNTPAMMAHLGGPETEEQLSARNEKCILLGAAGEAGINVILADGERAGVINFWHDNEVGAYEMGWSIDPAFHRRGVASAAVALALGQARDKHAFRLVRAVTHVDNVASNSLCRRVGFAQIGTEEMEYPPGIFSPSNIWQYDLDEA